MTKNSTIRRLELNQGYLMFTRDTDEEMARRVFEARYKILPENVFIDDHTGNLVAGPVLPEYGAIGGGK